MSQIPQHIKQLHEQLEREAIAELERLYTPVSKSAHESVNTS